MAGLLGFLRELQRAFDVSVLLVHHTAKGLPRMADACRLAMASAPVLGIDPEEMRRSLLEAERDAAADAVAADPVMDALRAILDKHGGKWVGTATQLRGLLLDLMSTREDRESMPKGPNALSARLHEMAYGLAEEGIHVTRGQEARRRVLTIEDTRPKTLGIRVGRDPSTDTVEIEKPYITGKLPPRVQAPA